MAADFFFVNKLDTLRDPVRNTRWRLLIPNTIFGAVGQKTTNGNSFDEDGGEDEFAIHVESFKQPKIELKTSQLDYMGFPSHFTTNAVIDGESTFTAKLLEDMRAYEMMLAWTQACINTGLLVKSPGGDDKRSDGNKENIHLGLGTHKDTTQANVLYNSVLRNNTIKVELYNWMNGNVMSTTTLINAFPKMVTIDDTFTQSADAKLVKFSFTLKYDRWDYHVNKEAAIGL